MDSTFTLTRSQKLLYELVRRLGCADDKTKLAKLQYFSDFIHYAFNDQPISEEGTLYERRPYGPLSATFNKDLNTLVEAGLLSNPEQYMYQTAKEIDTDLSEMESKTIDYVLNRYKDQSYDALVDVSHRQIPYLSSVEGGVVDYTTAYNLVDEYSDYNV